MHTDFIKDPEVTTRVEKTGFRRFTHWPDKRLNHALTNLKSPTTGTTHRFCEMIVTNEIGTLTCLPERCYPYFHEDNYFFNYVTDEYYYEDFSCEYPISTVCDPNFVDNDGQDCNWYARWGTNCERIPNTVLLRYGVYTVEGIKTGLNCPECGCGQNGAIRMHERD